MCKSAAALWPLSPPPIQHNGMTHYAHPRAIQRKIRR
ncbi:hypothetical protein ECIG_05613 [Escherichia coli M605]|uniref:Uncharacterized protein n=1 Tax=Escherichia coli M605 TaxID=656417 RepID=F4T900_ECOLX|nr:hypothetical protein ECIG_05646 [Escherichia coli M605]EGI12625.1 hypothetical protein ECIG_05640 [Escherichia coli M605]EGI12635.1 hypothetical protein ECIG_05613 [Escherichia coli M605]